MTQGPGVDPSEPSQRELARLDLARQLRRLRRQADLTGVELAQRLGWSQAKVSRVETGVTSITPADVAAFAAEVTDDGDVQRALVEQAEDLLTEVTSFQILYRQGAAAVQRSVAAAEQATRTLRHFQIAIVPGLLQTAEYARRVLSQFIEDERELGEAVAARLERQGLLYDPDRTFVFLLLENALRMTFGSHRVMRQQAEHIASISSLENVTIAVVPLNEPLSVVPMHGFTIHDDRLVDVETKTSQLAVHGRQEIAFYERVFDALQRHAVTGDEMRTLLREIAAHHAALSD